MRSAPRVAQKCAIEMHGEHALPDDLDADIADQDADAAERVYHVSDTAIDLVLAWVSNSPEWGRRGSVSGVVIGDLGPRTHRHLRWAQIALPAEMVVDDPTGIERRAVTGSNGEAVQES